MTLAIKVGKNMEKGGGKKVVEMERAAHRRDILCFEDSPPGTEWEHQKKDRGSDRI